MPIKLISPIEKDFTLDKSDKFFGSDGEPTRVTVRQATQRQHERRSAVFSEVTRVFSDNSSDDTVLLRQKWSFAELQRVEVFLTLVGCNILDEEGNQLFRFKKVGGVVVLDMNDHEFARAWGLLDPIIADEIHEKVLEVNFMWRTGPLAE